MPPRRLTLPSPPRTPAAPPPPNPSLPSWSQECWSALVTHMAGRLRLPASAGGSSNVELQPAAAEGALQVRACAHMLWCVCPCPARPRASAAEGVWFLVFMHV